MILFPGGEKEWRQKEANPSFLVMGNRKDKKGM